MNLQALLTLLQDDPSDRGFIMKPEDGWCAEESVLLTSRTGRVYRRRGRHHDLFDFDRYMRALEDRAAREKRDPSGVLIERRLEQGEFWRRLFPDSANTLRLLTLW